MVAFALRILTFSLLLFLAVCPSLASKLQQKRANDDDLTVTLANQRAAQVKSVNYQLWLTLTKGSDEYKGRTIITAQLGDTKRPLSVDFLWDKIASVKVNGEELKGYPTRKGSFDVPPSNLKPETVIEVDYINKFSKEGRGFQRVVDPEDQGEYFYTDFEPYDAHQMLPCFDQPNLRATLRLTIDAPREWKALGNELIKTQTTTGDRMVTEFVETKPIATYLFFAGAGPFVEWTDKYGKIPLTLYARKSLAKYVDTENIFTTTKKGLKFFGDYFGYPYPFSKFGQIFIPEFASGGMENPGMITYNERNIYRGAVSEATRAARDSLILHEMAHMWFGDLVTMNWWNDLWLNESFASYLAMVALDRAMGYKGTWLDNLSDKAWGYWQDQLVTTHPIETPVPDIRTAKGNFDGITYAKGSASLKQLHFFVGEEGFRNGLRSYFKKYQWQNTTREQFINEIAVASKKDLAEWTRAWLQTAGPNRVSTKWSCKDGKIDAFTLVQEPNASKSLSPHRTRIGIFKPNSKGKLELIKTQDATYTSAETKIGELIGTDCPTFVYPNLDDQDYALFALDEVSLRAAADGLTGQLSQPLLRAQVWYTLSQMVRDAKLAPRSYFEIVLPAIEKEQDTDLLGIVLHTYGPIYGNYFVYLTEEERTSIAPKLEQIAWSRTQEAPAGSSAQLTFFDFHTLMAQTPATLARLRGFLDGKELPKGFTLDQDRRWAILKALALNNHSEAATLIDAEEKKDPSTAGKRFAYAARAAIPTPSNKSKFWKEFQAPNKIPYSSLRAASGVFNNWNHVELSKPYVPQFFKKVTTMDWKAADNLVEIYFERLFPQNVCSATLLKESETKLATAKNLTPLAKRAWLEANDELSKCVTVRSTSMTKQR